jgi:hypothetical protein
MKNANTVLVGKPKRKRPRSLEDNIKIDFQDIGCEDEDWIEVA